MSRVLSSRVPRLLLLGALAGATTARAADDWPHWRGPERTGAVPAADLPRSWSAGENVAWKLALPGGGGSTPVIWEGQVFLTVASGEDILLWAVDRESGERRWERLLDDGNQPGRKGDLSSPSPVAGEEGVFAVTGTGVVAAFAEDGAPRWRRDLEADYGPFGILWGYASSPLLHDGGLYVQVLHGFHTDDPSYLLRLDPATGETVWRVERPTDALAESPDAYTSPMVVEHEGGTEIVVLGGDYLTGHDPATGRELWRAGGLNPGREKNYRIVASPVVVDDIVLAPTRVRPFLAFRAGGRGDVSSSHRLWSTPDGPDVPTPASDGEDLLILNDQGIMWRLDPHTGEVAWGPERTTVGTYSASPVLVGDLVYVVNEAGVVTVVQVRPEFRVVARNELGERTLASPAVAGDQLFLRTLEHLYCLEKGTGQELGVSGSPAFFVEAPKRPWLD